LFLSRDTSFDRKVAVGLKTGDLIEIDFVLMPFRSRNKRYALFEHRAAQRVGPKPRSLPGYTGGQVYSDDRWFKPVAEYDFFAGEVLALCPTPVFVEDDLQTLARRHYENEIWMLTNIDSLLEKPRPASLPPVGEPTMRMSSEAEARKTSAFDEYKQKFAVAPSP
jgi:hypothetical protein